MDTSGADNSTSSNITSSELPLAAVLTLGYFELLFAVVGVLGKQLKMKSRCEDRGASDFSKSSQEIIANHGMKKNLFNTNCYKIEAV